MEIRLNGQRMPVSEGASIGDLVRSKNLDPSAVVVEHNLAIVPSDDWDRVRLKADDVLEILRFVGGG